MPATSDLPIASGGRRSPLNIVSASLTSSPISLQPAPQFAGGCALGACDAQAPIFANGCRARSAAAQVGAQAPAGSEGGDLALPPGAAWTLMAVRVPPVHGSDGSFAIAGGADRARVPHHRFRRQGLRFRRQGLRPVGAGFRHRAAGARGPVPPRRAVPKDAESQPRRCAVNGIKCPDLRYTSSVCHGAVRCWCLLPIRLIASNTDNIT